jgi:hypothetical protein
MADKNYIVVFQANTQNFDKRIEAAQKTVQEFSEGKLIKYNSFSCRAGYSNVDRKPHLHLIQNNRTT